MQTWKGRKDYLSPRKDRGETGARGGEKNDQKLVFQPEKKKAWPTFSLMATKTFKKSKMKKKAIFPKNRQKRGSESLSQKKKKRGEKREEGR